MTEKRTGKGALLIIDVSNVSATIRKEGKGYRLDLNYNGATRYVGTYANERVAANAGRGMLERGEVRDFVKRAR